MTEFDTNLVRDTAAMCRVLFKDQEGNAIRIATYQEQIIRAILFKETDHTTIRASTQAGKSEAIALGCLLAGMFLENETITVVSATLKQAKIILDYMLRHADDHPLVRQSFNLEGEFNKSILTFKLKTIVKILSAGGSDKGESLLGHNATILIVDESGSIADDIYYQKVLRMVAAAGPRRVIIESGTPHRPNHFKRTCLNPGVRQIHVPYTLAMREGRISKEYIERIQTQISPTLFKIWYGAEFPAEAIDALIRGAHIEQALTPNEPPGHAETVFGVDVARYGSNFTVVTVAKMADGHIWIEKQYQFEKIGTMETVGNVFDLAKKHKPVAVYIDDTGVGGGVTDRFFEQQTSFNVTPVIFGHRAHDPQNYINKKAELGMTLAKLFENGNVHITPEANSDHLTTQLAEWRKEHTSNAGKLRIVDPERSPDHADSLLLTIAHLTDQGGGIELSKEAMQLI